GRKCRCRKRYRFSKIATWVAVSCPKGKPPASRPSPGDDSARGMHWNGLSGTRPGREPSRPLLLSHHRRTGKPSAAATRRSSPSVGGFDHEPKPKRSTAQTSFAGLDLSPGGTGEPLLALDSPVAAGASPGTTGARAAGQAFGGPARPARPHDAHRSRGRLPRRPG